MERHNAAANGLLLDTHAFYWWQTDNARLSANMRFTISSADMVYVSVVSAWEVAIKAFLGKIAFPGAFEAAVDKNGFKKLSISFAHAEAIRDLPLHHRDPFDRMLIVQALSDRLTLVTADRRFAPYSCDIAWI